MLPKMNRLLRRIYHYAVYVAAGAIIVVCVVALAFKFWLVPNIAGYRGMLEAEASAALGRPVSIGGLEADWRGLNPRVTILDVTLAPEATSPLRLPRVEAVFSWLSLPLFKVRLASLTLEQPGVDLNRDAAGVIYVAGIPVNLPGASSPLPDWLLGQPRVVVRDARVAWRDAKLGAPELRLSGVRLLLENRFGHHRFGGIAKPDAAAGRLELRGDLKGGSVRAWSTWSGEAYARVDDVRLESWGTWVPWAQQSVKSGAGNLRFWLTLQGGQVVGLAGDANLGRVAINLLPGLPDIAFDSLTGHLGWSRDKDSNSFFVERLRFSRPGSAPAEPASLRITLTPDGAGGFRRIGATASNLRLEAFTALTSAIPLPRKGHDLIEAYAPRGLVESAEGHWAGAGDYAVKLRVRDAGLQQHGAWPGLSGISARIQADQDKGEAEIEGAPNLVWPSLFRHELAFTRLEAEASWRANKDSIGVNFEASRIVNPDLEGTAKGRIELPGKGAPRVDIQAHLSRGEATAVYRYLPLKVSDDAYQWLKRGLQGGHSDNTRLVLQGALDRFPFDQGGGQFSVSVRMVDGVLDYAPGWPKITGIQGRLVFHDKAMTLEADSGAILDTRIGPVKAVIPDLHYSYDETVFIDGRATGETRAFLDFIRQSPVFAHIDGFTGPFKASGPGNLAISLRLPVRNIATSTVSGNFALQDNRLDPGGDLPELEGVTGILSFTDKDIQAKGLRLRVLDQPASLDIIGAGGGGALRVKLAGQATAESLRPYLPAALAPRLSGAAEWRADVGIDANHKTVLSVASDLVGMRIDLPAPLGKTAAQAVPLAITRQPGPGPDLVTARFGESISLKTRLAEAAPPRIGIRLGTGDAALPAEDGVWITGTLRNLDLDAWRGLDLPAGEGAPALREFSVAFNELKVANRRLHDTHVRLRPSGAGWSANLAGKEIIGEITTVPEAGGQRVLANLRRLVIPEQEGAAPESGLEAPGALRALDLTAASVAWKGKELGELRLHLSPMRQGFQVDSFQLTGPDSRLEAKGVVSDHPRRPTHLDLSLNVDNLGKLLGQLGSPGKLRNGAGRLAGNLTWLGGLEDFNFATLGGDLTLAVKQGQFLKVDPGAAKLLGVLSLQALPRRITLDFRDVFSEGFAFDEIGGNVHLERGSAYAKDLRMNGPAAKIRISGVVDLDRETQNLRFQIQPRLEDTVAVAGALLGGPVVGLGTLIANKVLQNPIGQAVAFDYAVTGTWTDPVVAKIQRPAAELPKPGESP